MSDKAMEKLLEKAASRVLYEMAKELLYSAKGANIDAAKAQLELDRKVVADMLKRRLLPLLEAGQKCRVVCIHREVAKAYDEAETAALQAVKGETSGT